MCASKQILKNKPPLSFPEGDEDFLELDEFNLWTGKIGGQQNIPLYVSIILRKNLSTTEMQHSTKNEAFH